MKPEIRMTYLHYLKTDVQIWIAEVDWQNFYVKYYDEYYLDTTLGKKWRNIMRGEQK